MAGNRVLILSMSKWEIGRGKKWLKTFGLWSLKSLGHLETRGGVTELEKKNTTESRTLGPRKKKKRGKGGAGIILGGRTLGGLKFGKNKRTR